MQYKFKGFKQIHWDDSIKSLNPNSPHLKLELELSPEFFNSQDDVSPIALEWRVRIFDDTQHVFSAMFVSRYLLERSVDVAKDLSDLILVLKHSHALSVKKWDENIKKTPLKEAYLKHYYPSDVFWIEQSNRILPHL